VADIVSKILEDFIKSGFFFMVLYFIHFMEQRVSFYQSMIDRRFLHSRILFLIINLYVEIHIHYNCSIYSCDYYNNLCIVSLLQVNGYLTWAEIRIFMAYVVAVIVSSSAIIVYLLHNDNSVKVVAIIPFIMADILILIIYSISWNLIKFVVKDLVEGLELYKIPMRIELIAQWIVENHLEIVLGTANNFFEVGLILLMLLVKSMFCEKLLIFRIFFRVIQSN
jgi:hypothetical protein